MSEVDQLIKKHKATIAKLEKRHDRIINKIQSAEEVIENTLGRQLCEVSDKLAGYNIGLDQLILAKEGVRRVKK